jgi:hypothetical protein
VNDEGRQRNNTKHQMGSNKYIIEWVVEVCVAIKWDDQSEPSIIIIVIIINNNSRNDDYK